MIYLASGTSRDVANRQGRPLTMMSGVQITFICSELPSFFKERNHDLSHRSGILS